MASLVEWKVFCQWLRKHSEASLPQNVSVAELNRFAARCRLVDSFERLVVTGYAEETADAYSALMKAFLAYTALEQFHKAIKPVTKKLKLIERWATTSPELVAELRREDTIIRFLAERMDRKTTRAEVLDFVNGETDNCLIVAKALRNAVAHGMMSVHPDGTSARAAEKFCDRISEMLIRISKQAFSDWCHSLPEYPEQEPQANSELNQSQDLAIAG